MKEGSLNGERGIENRGRDRGRRIWGREEGGWKEERKGTGKVAN